MTNFLEFLKEKEIKKQRIKVQKLAQKSLFFLVNSHYPLCISSLFVPPTAKGFLIK
jgi:hypothetical protein